MIGTVVILTVFFLMYKAVLTSRDTCCPECIISALLKGNDSNK